MMFMLLIFVVVFNVEEIYGTFENNGKDKHRIFEINPMIMDCDMIPKTSEEIDMLETALLIEIIFTSFSNSK